VDPHSLLLKIALPVIFVLVSCTPNAPFDREAETKKILALHHLQRDYHFNQDAESFAELFSPDYISVNRGVISQPTQDETLSRFQQYFSSVRFLEWDDMSDPVIRFSNDGSLAYTVVDKRVIIEIPDNSGMTNLDTTRFAWTTIYGNYGDHWKIESVTSTERARVK